MTLWYIPRNFFLLTQLHDDEDEDDNTTAFVFTAPRLFVATRIHDDEDDNTTVNEDEDDNTTIVVHTAPCLLCGRPRMHDDESGMIILQSVCFTALRLLVDHNDKDGNTTWVFVVYIVPRLLHGNTNTQR